MYLRITVSGLSTKNASRALIERPYSREPQAVGAVYDRPGFLVQSPVSATSVRNSVMTGSVIGLGLLLDEENNI